MKILFLRPADSEAFKIFAKAGSISMPIGIAYIAAYLKKFGHEIKIKDYLTEKYDFNEYQKLLNDFQPAIVGITTATPTIYNAFFLAQETKKINPQIKTIMGGHHVSALPEESITNPAVDFICPGEGEELMIDLIKAIENQAPLSQITGLYYKDNGQVRWTGRREYIKDIDQLPFPARELLNTDQYRISATRKRTTGKADIIVTSRGCPYNCNFCSKSVFGQSIRYRSPENVIKEVEEVINNYGVKEIQFVDDTLTVNHEHVMEICRLIIKKNLKFVWGCHSRVNNLSDEMLSLMRQAGCRELAFGVESGNQEVLDAIGKRIKLSDVKEAVKLCRKNKLLALCGFIIGHIQDTKKTVMETIKFACRLNPDFANFSILTPMPGSQVFQIALAKGLIDNTKYDQLIAISGAKPIAVGNLSPEELIHYQKLAYRRFYFRPAYLIKKIAKIKSWEEIKMGLIGIKTIISHQLYRYFK